MSTTFHYGKAIAFSLLLAGAAAAQPIPGIEWSQVTWPPHTFGNALQTQVQSGEDWWYSHKNLYTSGSQTGYIMVGYTSLVSTAASYTSAQQMYNEGTDSPCNPIISANYNYLVSDSCADRDYVGEHRTPARGNLGKADLNGNMVWCKPRTVGDLQEVIQDPLNPDYVYVVGAHGGVKPFNNYTGFIPYNRTAASPSDYFSITQLGAGSTYTNDSKGHMYVAKIDISVAGGSVVWEGLYGYRDYSSGILAAYQEITAGYDIILNSSGNLVAVGGANSKPFLITINPSNGYVINKNLLSNSFTNSTGYCTGGIGHSLVEIGSTSNYAIAALYEFEDSVGFINPLDRNRAFIWCVNSSLNPASWSTNPLQIPGAGTSTAGTVYNSNVWEIKYHNALQQLLVPVVRDCESCIFAGSNSGKGFIYRLTNSGVIATPVLGGVNPSPMGDIRAFDLRIGVEETSDGGFIAVSTTRPAGGYHTAATSTELGYMSTCTSLPLTDFDGFWDTDALVSKFHSSGVLLWDKTFDVSPNRSRQPPPGDLKLQECLYKISQAQDGGYVISGNSSFNFDDNYLVKLNNECNGLQTYTTGFGYVIDINSNTTWNSSMNVLGQVIVHPGAVLTISGSSTKIRFADRKLCSIPTNITVMPGARLDITSGAELTSIDYTTCPGSMWDGIFIQGNSSLSQNYSGGFATSQGLVSMSSGAIISNARNAITTAIYNSAGVIWSSTGGIISASDSYFINNERDAQFLYYHNPVPNRSKFTNCQFLTTGKLNNGVIPTGRISMYEVMGVQVNGCKFSYSGGSDYAEPDRGYGIYSMDAQYNVGSCLNPPTCNSVQQCTFENLSVGVDANNTNVLRVVNVDDAVFTNNYTGAIILSSVNGANITGNTITTHSSNVSGSGIYLNNCKTYFVANNSITGTNGGAAGVGIYASYSGVGNHRIYRNTLSNLLVGIAPQYDNSGYTNHNDGLVMNCNTFTGTANVYDIAMMGAYPSGEGATVADIQGVALPLSVNPLLLVRNQYGATCGSNNKWFIWPASYNKTVQHAANSDSDTQPNFPTTDCADALVNVITTPQSLNFTFDCPSNPSVPFCPCGGCCRLSSINHLLDSVQGATHSMADAYTATVDHGSTFVFLGYVQSGILGARLKDTLLAHSPYLSDTVMSAYFGDVSVTAADVIDVHHNNAPVNPLVWQVIKDRAFSPDDTTTLHSQQGSAPISARQTLDGQLAWARSELQSVFAAKLNYFLNDTLPASQDSVISLLYTNSGGLPDALPQLVNAYRNKGAYSRAFTVVDSLSSIPAYTEIMTLQALFLKLDTSASHAYALLNDGTLSASLLSYAADSTKQGSALARALARQVYGTPMFLPRLLPGDAGARHAAGQGANAGAQNKGPGATKSFKVYPNPAAGSFTIFYTDPGQGALWYSIANVVGQVLDKGALLRGSELEMSANSFGAGIYFISVGNGSQILQQQKLVIVK